MIIAVRLATSRFGNQAKISSLRQRAACELHLSRRPVSLVGNSPTVGAEVLKESIGGF
jgi:hypothetical protein